MIGISQSSKSATWDSRLTVPSRCTESEVSHLFDCNPYGMHAENAYSDKELRRLRDKEHKLATRQSVDTSICFRN